MAGLRFDITCFCTLGILFVGPCRVVFWGRLLEVVSGMWRNDGFGLGAGVGIKVSSKELRGRGPSAGDMVGEGRGKGREWILVGMGGFVEGLGMMVIDLQEEVRRI